MLQAVQSFTDPEDGGLDSHDEIEPPNETTPLVQNDADSANLIAKQWKPPPGFYWIQLG
jgi:hypothetical protein